MTNLAPHADQAVRHAVDAYIDGRLQPMFEGDCSFETRNSRYHIRDGVLLSAPNGSLLGAEFVGWLIEFSGRSEVSATWKTGARAILVDTRNDGVKGPHIIVTSATRGFRSERAGAPAPSAVPGSRLAQGGSPADQGRAKLGSSPPIPPPPVSPSWGLVPPAHVAAPLPPPPAVPAGLRANLPVERSTPLPASVPPPRPIRPGTLPPPPPMAKQASSPPPPPRPLPRVSPPSPPPPPAYADSAIARRIMATVDSVPARFDLDDSAPTGRSEKSRSPSRLAHGASVGAPAHSRELPQSGLPPMRMPPSPPANVPFLLSRSYQRGMPLR